MVLTAELFEQTLSTLRAERGKAPEQRRHPRVGVRCLLNIIPLDNGTCGKTVGVWTRDISESGIGVISSKSMKKGNQFLIRLPRRDETATTLLCTVTSCNLVADKLYSIGAQFGKVIARDGNPAPDAAGAANDPEVERVRKAMLS
jgi:hypothetical protein